MQNFTARHILLSALFIAASPSRATPVTVSYSGDIWVVYDNQNALGVTPGMAFTMSFSYDDSTPDSDPDPLRGKFNQALTSWTYTFGNGVVLSLDTTQPNKFDLWNLQGVSRFGITGYASGVNGYSKFFLDYSDEYFYNGSPNVLTDVVSQNGWRLLGGALVNEITAFDATGTPFFLLKATQRSEIVVSTPPSVPVPATAWLFASSLLSFAGFTISRCRKATI